MTDKECIVKWVWDHNFRCLVGPKEKKFLKKPKHYKTTMALALRIPRRFKSLLNGYVALCSS